MAENKKAKDTSESRDEKALLEKLGKALRSKQAAIVMHNNPDPDSLAAAFGMRLLLRRRFNVSASLYYGGMIGRAENRCMVNQLKIPVNQIQKDINELDLRTFRTIIMVDTQPGAGNNIVPSDIIPQVVIDHHRPIRKLTRKAAFYDVTPGMGSSSTIITGYLRAADIKIPRAEATALVYGIKTDTYDLGRDTGYRDVDQYRFLLDKIDRKRIHNIEHPIHLRSYYVQLHRALQCVEIYDDACITVLEDIEYPEITAELSDWFYNMWGIHWVLAIGVENSGKIYLSLRIRNRKRKAGKLIRQIAGRRGMAGGHEQIAGGVVIAAEDSPEAVQAEIKRIKKRFLKAIGIDESQKPVPLIPPS